MASDGAGDPQGLTSQYGKLESTPLVGEPKDVLKETRESGGPAIDWR